MADRAALHGFIARIEALGLELVELQRLPPSGFVTDPVPDVAGKAMQAGERHRNGWRSAV